MALSQAQLTALATDINAQASLATARTNKDATLIANFYIALTSPSFVVWKTNVAINATGQAFNGTELAGMTTANQSRLQTIAMYLAGGYNAALDDVRQMFNDIWSGAGGTNTRANLLVLWKRTANVGEKLFAGPPGSGTDAVPAKMTFEGAIRDIDVQQAMGW